MRLNNISLGISASAFGLSLLVGAFAMPSLPHLRFGAGLFPGIIGAGLVLVGLMLAFSAQADRPPLFSLPDWAHRRDGVFGIVLMLGLLLSYFLLAETVGFIPMAVLILTSLLVFKGVRLVSAVLIAVAMALFIVQFFGGVLSVPLPWGVLEPYARWLSWT